MEIVGLYSFNNGEAYVRQRYPHLLAEVQQTVRALRHGDHKTKISREKSMPDRQLYNPRSLNAAFKTALLHYGWTTGVRILCDYPTAYYVGGYQPAHAAQGAFRELDFVKERLGVEVQFGKYAFMVYNVCAKMTIFSNHGFIDAGIEIVPVKEFADQMSTGVSYFEQFVWDLEQRGVSDIDIPVLILGIS